MSSLDLRVRADFEQAMEECGGVRSAMALELSLPCWNLATFLKDWVYRGRPREWRYV